MRNFKARSDLQDRFDTQRRHWLRRGGALGLSALGAATLGPLALLPRSARAADYKALVCLFQYGGNDGMNCVVPSDTSRYNQYAAVRGPLAIAKSSLVPLPGVSYGLHPSMAALLPFWNNSTLAPVFNVGPLKKPLTKAQFIDALTNAPGDVPPALYSHSDQQLLWESGGVDLLGRTGWGGRGSTVMGTVNPVISVGGNGRFATEELRSPWLLPGPGSYFGAYGLSPQDITWEPNRLRKLAVDAMYAQPQGNVLADAMRGQQRAAFEVSQRLAGVVGALPGDPESNAGIDSAFAPLTVDGQIATYVGAQLYQVAKLIHQNAVVQGSRQMFFAQQGGYDTHNGQLGQHAGLLKELADAMAAFQRAMNNLGMSQQVTLFTQSDFGRTFVPNASDGTDHAWGNHQIVLGGAVKGKKTYGVYPSLVVGGADDTGVEDWELQGRWLPSSAVDQYAATLLTWFGATSAQLDATLPNLLNFGSNRSLGFV
jgi:uncharacterized protein (DUF1501 family)